MPTRLFALSRWQKRLLMILSDLLLIPFALWAGFALRHSSWTPPLNDGVWLLFIAPVISIPLFVKLGLYRAIIRFLGNQALSAVFKGVSLSAIALLLITYLADFKGIPRSVFLIYWGSAFLFVGGSRYLARRLFQLLNNQIRQVNIAIYGAGSSGAQLAQALFSSPEYRPALFVDDNPTLQGAFVHSLRIYHPDQLSALIERYDIKQVLLAMPSASMARRREILHTLEPLPVHVRSIPGMADLVSGNHSIEEIREIEIDELLGRVPVAPEHALLTHCIQGKNILVTGAGGSIGSELCRQIICLQPKKLVLFELSEFALYQIEQELQELIRHEHWACHLISLLGSVQNQQRVESILREHQVETLYHAAAYKHVPLVEHNPIEGLQNNILGTFRTAQAAQQVGISHFVLISTDKAVRPTNVMGASKRMAELALQALAQLPGNTVFSMVRFGNVLGSSGSVVPLFRQQIRQGGPVTVTHPDITRFFMTIPEAAQLVIQAGSMAKGGEVFLLDMGESVKITDLAERMIRLTGLSVQDDNHLDGDIKIEFTGLRPGEKLYEELLIDSDAENTAHPRIFHAHEHSISWSEYQQIIKRLTLACTRQDLPTLYELLQTYVSGYQPPAVLPSAQPLPIKMPNQRRA